MSRCFALLLLLASVPAAAQARPRLGVLVVFDQLRSTDLDRLEPLFGPGGFGGLGSAGAARYDALYAFAATETGPGHATLATGANPSVHGVPLNTWMEGKEAVYCAFDPLGEVLGAPEQPRRGPAQLKAGTLADALKIESGGRARVVAIGGKDRSAILSAGRAADLALWYDDERGRYTSSRAYVDALPPWAERLGVELPRRSFARGAWSPLPFPEGFDALAPDDAQPGESPVVPGASTTFPHDLATMTDEAARRRMYRATPQSMSDVFELAEAAIDAEKLGADVVPDLLVVSVSTTDYVGHHYGPTSLEHVDLLRRAHMELRRFVASLERRFGRRGFALVVASDHGATPPVEETTAAGWPVARISRVELKRVVGDALAAALPKDARARDRFVRALPPDVFLDLAGLPPEQAAAALAAARAAVERLPGVAATVHVDDVGPDPYRALYVAGAYPGRSGTFHVRQEPRVTFEAAPGARGTDHGTPYTYDRRVPIFVVGAEVKRGRSTFAADPRDVAPTLAWLLRAPPPDQSEGRPLPCLGD